MGAATILRRARKRIADPKRWTQGALARRTKARECEPKDGDACRWCAVGAVRKAAPSRPTADLAVQFLNRAAEQSYVHGRGIVSVNDGYALGFSTRASRRNAHRMTLAIFDRAIELAEAEQS